MRIRVISIHFLLLLLFTAFKLQAAPVNAATAQVVAACFYSQHYSAGNVNLTLAYTETDNYGNAEYYIYNVNTNDGFVIVSADDATHPIIGYNNAGHYKTGPQPPHIAFWLQHYKKQVDYIRSQKLSATADIQNEWTAYKNNRPTPQTQRVNGAGVSPLLSCTWAQAPYFNADCPDTCVAGCVATAMGQIMKYWAFPPHGIGNTTDHDPTYGDLWANFDTTHYNWASMPANITQPNQEVANLMYDLGIAVSMEYTAESSGSYVISGDAWSTNGVCAQSAYPGNFGYNAGTLQGLYRTDYSDNDWINLLENELNNHRPLQYEGAGTDGGHSWVCDGYNSIGDFHMNWGWGGYLDGYYNLSSLNPGGTPLSSDQEALIGIEPSTVVSDFSTDKVIVRAGDTVHFTDNSFGTTPVTKLQWNFSGGTIVATTDSGMPGKAPMVIYATPGTYEVDETVSTSKASTTTMHYNYITVLDNDGVNVYPTANNGNFTIRLHDGSLTGSHIQFDLYNTLGEKVYTATLTNYTTQVNLELPHGLYIFHAVANNHVLSWGKMAIGD